MGFFEGLAEAATGGLGKTILEGFKSYFPPNMSEEQKANIQLAAQQIELQRTIEFSRAQNDAEKTLNERIAMYEGSAADLKGIPILGPLMLFLRGSQRVCWGFAAIYLDFMVFSNTWNIEKEIIANAFWVLNFLVLGFLFGERAVTNIMPFLTNFMQAKQAAKESK